MATSQAATRTGSRAAPRCGDAQAATPGRPEETPVDAVLTERARRALTREVEFIYNPCFDDPAAEAEILAEPPDTGRGPAKRPAGLPAYVASLYEVPLLTAEEEVALFRKMNYLKCRANRLRSQVDPRRPDPALLDEFDRLLAAERAVRDRIARANLRLVVSIARKFADRENPFDDFVSDGNLALLYAIGKFDYARGFRFSTYATHAVRRSIYRQVREKRRRTSLVAVGATDLIDETVDGREPRRADEGQYRQFRLLIEQMPDRLDDRERAILDARFGLHGDGKGLTLQKVAARLGLCKERVRQLQNRAIGKLRELARELNVEAPAFGT
ncbi:MAG TPA: sigma-70 family RNA polymerase sigma factor [Planctomycetaceae bacterium]